MRLTELRHWVDRAPRGTYYGAHPTTETRKAIYEFLNDHQIPNPIAPEKIHATIVYSRVFCGTPALGALTPHWEGGFNGWNVWPTSQNEEEPAHCLTLAFECPQMFDRHHHLRSKGATHDFPDFIPHMTMSYDVGGEFEHGTLPDYDGPIVFHHEYSEPLNSDWVRTKGNK